MVGGQRPPLPQGEGICGNKMPPLPQGEALSLPLRNTDSLSHTERRRDRNSKNLKVRTEKGCRGSGRGIGDCERERERQTDRQRETDRDRQREREREYLIKWESL